MKTFKEFFEDFSHYPEQIDPKKDKTKGDWITGDPVKPIVVSDGDIKSVLDKANKDVAILCNHKKTVPKNFDASV